jgi:cytochrome c biogenesis protein CcmG, thiol:disulfide interchange protein DsbE
MNWRVFIAGAVLTVPLVWLLASGFGKDPRELPSVMEGRDAPGFVLADLDGSSPVSLESLHGRVVVLNFWATWCGPCAMEHEDLQATAKHYTDRGVVFLGLLYGDQPAAAKVFLSKAGSSYENLDDPNQAVAIDYGVAGVPETFVIARNGRIVKKFVGPVDSATLSAVIEGLL